MAHTSTLIQSDNDFYAVTEAGSVTTLSPPSTVTVSTTRTPRFEVSGVHAIVVNSVDQALITDDAGIMLFLSPPAPTAAPTLSSPTAGALTGTFLVCYTLAIRTLDDVIVAESGFSASASTGAIVAKKITVSNLQLLSGLTPANYNSRYEVVRRVYRTAAGGSTFFYWHTVEDNTTTTFTEDAATDVLGASALATVPFLSHIASFKERLYGVSDTNNREQLLYSETGLRWAWPTDNLFTMPQTKGDAQSGITALMPRKDSLGISKSNMFIQLTGEDDSNWTITTLSTSIGCVSQESCALYRDNWYFLGQDGVYRWGEDGLQCISDPKVRSWFTTDTYFDREAFTTAFAVVDVIAKIYRLYLTDVDDNIVWVEYDIESNTWWGPHVTAAYDITAAFPISSHSPLICAGTSTGYVALETDTRADATDTAIEVNAVLAPITGSNPPQTTYFGTLTPEVAAQSAGQLYIYPAVGELDVADEPPFRHDINLPTTALGRLGYGRYLRLRFYHNTKNQLIQLLGFEVDPINIVGKRQ